MSTQNQQDLVAAASKSKYGNYGTALVDLILAQIGFALAGVEIFGIQPMAFLKGWATDLTQQAANALSSATVANGGVAATNYSLSTTGGKPLHEGIDVTADSTILYTAATDILSVTSTAAYWGFIRIGRLDQKQAVTCIAKQSSGTVTLFVFDIYRLEVDGSATYLTSTANLAGALSGTSSWIQDPIAAEVPVQYGDIIAVQCRVAGGTVGLTGRNTPNAANNIGRPYQLGGIRDASVTPTPATISTATMDAMYTTATPFIQLGALISPAATSRSIADDFQNGLGKWIERHHTTDSQGHDNGDFSISGGQLVYGGSVDGYQGGVYQVPLVTDDFDASVWVSNTTIEAAILIAASDQAMSSYVGIEIYTNSVYIISDSSFGALNRVASATISDPAGYIMKLTYRVADKTWRVYRNDSQVLTWTEPSSGGPQHGVGHRYFGAMITHALFTSGAHIDNFTAKDANI